MAYEFKNPCIKIFEHSGVADGASFSSEWDADESYTLKYIFVKADGARTTKSTITLWIANTPITKDRALCNTFGSNPEDALPLNVPLAKGTRVKYEGVNREGATKDFTVELVLERG